MRFEDYQGFGRSSISGAIHELKSLNLIDEWSDVYLKENGDKANGGEFGLANIQAQALGNRTEYLLKAIAGIAKYLNQYTPDGVERIKTKFTHGTVESGQLQIKTNGKFLAKIADDSVDLFDGKTKVKVNGKFYAPVDSDIEFYAPPVNQSTAIETVQGDFVSKDEVDGWLQAEWSVRSYASDEDIIDFIQNEWSD